MKFVEEFHPVDSILLILGIQFFLKDFPIQFNHRLLKNLENKNYAFIMKIFTPIFDCLRSGDIT